MKVFVYIFSVYLFLLWAVPCAQDDCAHEDEGQELLSHDESQPEQQETCPPYCNDKCCAGHVFLEPSHDLILKAYSSKENLIVGFVEIATSCQFKSIWQPPRV